MHITDRTLMIYKNLFNSIAYIGKKRHFAWNMNIIILILRYQTTITVFFFIRQKKGSVSFAYEDLVSSTKYK